MEHGGHHVPGIGDLLFPAINFAIFSFLAVRNLAGPISEYFRARTQQIREGLAAGAQAKKTAEALRAELTKDRADLPALRARLTSDLRGMAEQQRDRILAEAKEASGRIRRDAEIQAEQEVSAARHTLRREVIDLAIQKALQLVGGNVTAADQDRFVREFVQRAGSVS